MEGIANGRKIGLLEYYWFGNSSLAVQFWPLYILSSEKNVTIPSI